MQPKDAAALDEFVVKESTFINYTVGSVLLVLFVFAALFADVSDTSLMYAAALFAVPALLYLAKGKSGNVFIRMNVSGFYYKGQLLCGWNNFVSATAKEREVVGSIKDNFVLYFSYYNSEGVLYNLAAPLSNTLDKSEEEIIAAINRFYIESTDLDATHNLSR